LDYRSELLSLTSELPGHYAELEALLEGEGMGEALSYHCAIWALLHDPQDGGGSDAYPEDTFFPTLKRIRSGERCKASTGTAKQAQDGPVELDWDGNNVTQATTQPATADDDVQEGQTDTHEH
jgi:hypothetical protein